jgi:hypothetical protein
MSDCACIYIPDEGESPAFVRTDMPCARKVHCCDECRRDILPGERYERVTGVWDGRFETFKTCPDCLSIREAMFCTGWNFEMVISDLKDHVLGMQGQISEDCLATMTPKARGIVCELIEEAWEDAEII